MEVSMKTSNKDVWLIIKRTLLTGKQFAKMMFWLCISHRLIIPYAFKSDNKIWASFQKQPWSLPLRFDEWGFSLPVSLDTHCSNRQSHTWRVSCKSSQQVVMTRTHHLGPIIALNSNCVEDKAGLDFINAVTSLLVPQSGGNCEDENRNTHFSQ